MYCTYHSFLVIDNNFHSKKSELSSHHSLVSLFRVFSINAYSSYPFCLIFIPNKMLLLLLYAENIAYMKCQHFHELGTNAVNLRT